MKPLPKSEAGITLVELLVVLILLGIVGGIVTSAIVTSLQSATNTTSRVLALNELETALQRMSRDLRVAEEFQLDETMDLQREVTVQIFRNNDERDVTYSIQEINGQDVLVRQDTGQTLVTIVDNEDEPMLTYLDGLGDPITCETDCSAEYSGATQVRLRLVRGIDGRSPVVVETLVSIRNLRYSGSKL